MAREIRRRLQTRWRGAEVPQDWDSTGRGWGSGVQPFVDGGEVCGFP